MFEKKTNGYTTLLSRNWWQITMYTIYMYLSLCLVAITLGRAAAINNRPIIGVLAQETNPNTPQPGDTYIQSTYIKYLESAGARVAPIRVKEPYDYYVRMFNSLNGVLFPGGGVNLNTSEFAKAGNILYDMALKANDAGDYFPLWGTCLGFEFLATVTSKSSPLSKVSAMDIALPLTFTNDFNASRLFGNLPDDVYRFLKTENVTENFHHYGLTPETFDLNVHLKDFYHVLSTNIDKYGKHFISTMEGYKYPVYATQWHPEKPSFTWNLAYHINHGPHAIRVLQHMANFLVAEARKSDHHFATLAEEAAALIDNYSAKFSKDSRFTDTYYFNYTRSWKPSVIPEYVDNQLGPIVV